MQFKLPYGRTSIQVNVPDSADIADLKQYSGPIDIRTEIRRALDHPIGCRSLKRLAQGHQNAVIVINDTTRPAPNGPMLQALIEDLRDAGISNDRVTVVIACGNHRPCTHDEIRKMVGDDLAKQLHIINHECTNREHLVFVGHTRTGLPVWVNKTVAHASLKILTGLIAPHHSAGYSGGRKSLLPGVAGLETLKSHHSFPIRPFEPAYGWMKGNPFHEESVRIARRVGIDFILNMVQDSRGNFFKAVAGEVEVAHEKGVEIGKPYWELWLPHRYDVVVVTPGGYPRDIDLHQAQKALSTAEMVVAQDGVIVMVAECRDGVGKWGEWLKQAQAPDEVIERFKKEGFNKDHTSKAFMFARALSKHVIIIHCSGIHASELKEMFLTPAPTPQDTIDMALEHTGLNARMLVIPRAVNCVPKVIG